MCYTPVYIEKHEATVPCGKCPKCLSRRASAWSFRLMNEEKNSKSAHFVTLTYDTDHVPLSKNGFMTLSIPTRKGKKTVGSDLQNFLKKLRKNFTYGKIKYYAVGEYGGEKRRPHYHLILFNATEEGISRSWDKGSIYLGNVQEASVGYVLLYIQKPKFQRLHGRDDRHEEFVTMSKGLGQNYLSKSVISWHLASPKERIHLNLPGGKKCTLPRYYRERIGFDPEDLEAAAFEHVKKLRKVEEQNQRIYGDRWEHIKKLTIENEYKKMHQKALSKNKSKIHETS